MHEGETADILEAHDADFFPPGTSMSLTAQGTAVSAFTFAVATPGTINTGHNTRPPASSAGLAPLWINEIKQDRDTEGEFWEVAADPGADSTGRSIARGQERSSEKISRPISCGTSRAPIPPLRETTGGLLVAVESTTLQNVGSSEQGLPRRLWGSGLVPVSTSLQGG